jgi:hypothetical protein
MRNVQVAGSAVDGEGDCVWVHTRPRHCPGLLAWAAVGGARGARLPLRQPRLVALHTPRARTHTHSIARMAKITKRPGTQAGSTAGCVKGQAVTRDGASQRLAAVAQHHPGAPTAMQALGNHPSALPTLRGLHPPARRRTRVQCTSRSPRGTTSTSRLGCKRCRRTAASSCPHTPVTRCSAPGWYHSSRIDCNTALRGSRQSRAHTGRSPWRAPRGTRQRRERGPCPAFGKHFPAPMVACASLPHFSARETGGCVPSASRAPCYPCAPCTWLWGRVWLWGLRSSRCSRGWVLHRGLVTAGGDAVHECVCVGLGRSLPTCRPGL